MDNVDEALVLIVDDNAHNLQVIGSIVRKGGFKAAVAQNGIQAVEFVRKKKPDLILMDVMMPEMDGFTACSKILEDEASKHIPIIFLTALSDMESKLKGFEAGGMDYITKPFMKEEVLARISVHLKLKKALEKLKGMSVTDEMTGVYNRRFAYEMIEKQIDVSKRKHERFLLCYIDIDNLKIINDQFGHDSGDMLIKMVVEGLLKAVRQSDYLFRMGGDEFLLLLANMHLNDAEKLLKRIQNELNRKTIHDVVVDFSFGFAEYSSTNPLTADQLIHKADKHMYRNKRKKKK